MRARTWLMLALCGSLGGNAYLLGVELRGSTSQPLRAAESARPTQRAAPKFTRSRAPTASYTGLGRQDLEARLARVEGQIHKYLSLDQRWREGSRSTADEELVQYVVDEALARLDPAYELDCRDRVCRVMSERNYDEWIGGLRARWLIGSYQVSAEEVFLHLAEPADAAASKQIYDAGDAFLRSRELAQCKQGVVDVGHFELIASFEEAHQSYRVTASGPLKRRPVAMCAARAFEDALSTLMIARDAPKAGGWVGIDVP